MGLMGLILKGYVQIYLAARGFFIVVFEKFMIKIRFFVTFGNWEDKFTLMMKPWHSTFNLAYEVFDMVPIWVRLPNFPLHFW